MSTELLALAVVAAAIYLRQRGGPNKHQDGVGTYTPPTLEQRALDSLEPAVLAPLGACPTGTTAVADVHLWFAAAGNDPFSRSTRVQPLPAFPGFKPSACSLCRAAAPNFAFPAGSLLLRSAPEEGETPAGWVLLPVHASAALGSVSYGFRLGNLVLSLLVRTPVETRAMRRSWALTRPLSAAAQSDSGSLLTLALPASAVHVETQFEHRGGELLAQVHGEFWDAATARSSDAFVMWIRDEDERILVLGARDPGQAASLPLEYVPAAAVAADGSVADLDVAVAARNLWVADGPYLRHLWTNRVFGVTDYGFTEDAVVDLLLFYFHKVEPLYGAIRDGLAQRSNLAQYAALPRPALLLEPTQKQLDADIRYAFSTAFFLQDGLVTHGTPVAGTVVTPFVHPDRVFACDSDGTPKAGFEGRNCEGEMQLVLQAFRGFFLLDVFKDPTTRLTVQGKPQVTVSRIRSAGNNFPAFLAAEFRNSQSPRV